MQVTSHTRLDALSSPSVRNVLFLVLLASAAYGQNSEGIKNLKDADLDLMNNHDPNSQLENFELLPDYQVNLFAADPMFANPVHMHWDSKGRLWVACSWAYPQLKPGDVADDKIIILEDTDDDGVADKSNRFRRRAISADGDRVGQRGLLRCAVTGHLLFEGH